MFDDIDAVLFDLDGTLVDSAPDLGAAADKMRTDRGMSPLALERYRAMAGAGARGMIGVALGLTPEDSSFKELREEFFQNYERCMSERTFAFDGVVSVIDSIVSAGLQWGVVTNKSERFTLPLTAAMPMFQTAGVIVCGDTTPFAKPHPEPLLEAARRLSLLPNRCVYVGDDERDIIAGCAAGMRTVAAAYGYLGASADTTTWKADATIGSPSSLLNLLRMA